MLIVPKRHCEDYFGLTIEEKLSIDKLVLRCQQRFYFFPNFSGPKFPITN
jgi:hypothetical protein